jgi:hypothetical protein
MPQFREIFFKKSDIDLQNIVDAHGCNEIGSDAKTILHERESLRKIEESEKQDEVNRESLLIAKESNRIALDAKIWAIIAAIIAVIAIYFAK